MTANQMTAAIGQTVRIRFESLVIDCKILDVKCSWGKPRFLVEPLTGSGSQWVEESRIR